MQNTKWHLPIGARPDERGARFRVWAASARRVEVVLFEHGRAGRAFELTPEPDGYFAGHVAGVAPGDQYMYRLDGGDPRPDPASRFQPAGVHGPSQVVDPAAFAWSDEEWRGIPLDDLVVYELHVGAATPAGTFDALIERLDDLRALGVTALELMPVADFPGERGWGYDGVDLFAPSRAYGGPEALRRLVDAAHARGLAVMLDVVYNHLGPDGNYLRQFSRAYFAERHKTPWGDALNFDGPGSRPVRDFFAANACYWAHEYHLDGLRLDATHAMLDDGPVHVLAEIAASVHASLPPDRHFLLIVESENNDPRLVRPSDHRATSTSFGSPHPPSGAGNALRFGGFDEAETAKPQQTSPSQVIGSLALPASPAPSVSSSRPGYGLDGVWADDFHHQLRAALAGDREGYYADYSGTAEEIAATLRQGWFYVGQRSAFAGRPRGAPAEDVPPPRFVHCIQNHDQIGNRALGERLNHDVPLDAYRAASALLLLSPYTPLLWMGQEWAASTPFLYFSDHHAELGRLVTEGRRAEFAAFSAFAGAEVPDPQAPETFLRSKLRWEERDRPPHAGVLRLYRDLLDLRRRLPALRARERGSFSTAALGDVIVALRRAGPRPADELLIVANLGGRAASSPPELALAARPETAPPAGRRWQVLLDSEDDRYGGRGRGKLSEAGALPMDGPRALVVRLGQ